LRRSGQYSKAGRDKSFARAIILMCLMAHAGLVSLTHHHDLAQRPTRAASASFDSSQPGGSGKQTGNIPGTCCLSCCLLQNFLSSIRKVDIYSDFAPQPLILEALVQESGSGGVSLVLSNRAPPVLVADAI
jgi:hypothetical protein